MVPDYKNTERPSRCSSCGNGPCHDGTACNGARKVVGEIVLVTGSTMSIGSAFARSAALSQACAAIMRHPRYQQVPTSPKPGFRKR